MKKQWKTLARPMFSMNSLNFIDSWLVPGDSLKNHKFMENIGLAKFMENIGQANVFHEFLFFLDSWLIRRFSGKPQIHGKHWPGQSFHCFFHENIGQANVFHEFLVCPRFLDGPRRFSEKPQIHGKHWPGQCFPWLFHRNSWKTLAWPMFSMNLWFSRKSSGWSQEIL